jgi:hypothetical protein
VFGFGVWGLGFGVWGLGFEVWVYGLGVPLALGGGSKFCSETPFVQRCFNTPNTDLCTENGNLALNCFCQLLAFEVLARQIENVPGHYLSHLPGLAVRC